MKKFLLILLFAIALSTENESDIPETTKSKWVEILEKNYIIFYERLPINLKKAVHLSRTDKTWEKFILKLEKLGEENAIKICPKNGDLVPLPRPGHFSPENYPEICQKLVKAIVDFIKRYKN